jgi:ubiquinol-cytochrome c reductase cytochrome b subunit/menaquinol-cytochrome c reductase cytochrome b/c subunit
MPRAWRVLIVASALAPLAGCGGEPTEPSPTTAGQAGPPSEIDLSVAPEYASGKRVVAQSGCLACHRLGEAGNRGPGPNLTTVGSALTANEIARSVVEGPGVMPRYDALEQKKPKQFASMVAFLASLDGS